ncbi:GNAT family N-acetyltransferase [Deminuibacter soli]|uniref:N-acetyltransferase n=1 Tax=Deminuibacter soli TaxID=2291815 RepID=A0A3E1NRJ9_9BACT|nr:GNAT family N-acetyltransferase [Deminuibacter soli]RFM30464.1 N-acetyltransferase [Deminuibacter soli]
MNDLQIIPFTKKYGAAVATLITHIQQNEFNVPVTLADQPDLQDIPGFYQQGRGNFWCAVNSKDEVVGTIALIDTGTGVGAIRKMFVRADYRGAGVALQLLQLMEAHAVAGKFTGLYLGTVPVLQAALRFYEKNGYVPVKVTDLPEAFPRMPVDTLFYCKQL